VQTCEVHGCTNKGVVTGRRDFSLPTFCVIEQSPPLEAHGRANEDVVTRRRDFSLRSLIV
jgi:hypothetical protein